MTKPDCSRIGGYVTDTTAGKSIRAYIPPQLPPCDLDWASLLVSLGEAGHGLGELKGVSSILPDSLRFLSVHARKEAVLSSQIEGFQCSLGDLLLFEKEINARTRVSQKKEREEQEVREVLNYVQAAEYGFERVREGFPVCSRLIREMHERLMIPGSGGSRAAPGQFRRKQNWIGGTRPENASYVPPPHWEIDKLMSDLEKFINQSESKLPALIKAALAHVQFEMIHPFLDGNGRVGRILIALILRSEGVLDAPVLYLSRYFKQHRPKYYELLQEVQKTGDWEAWLDFFLKGVAETSSRAADVARNCRELFEKDRERIEKETGRSASSIRRVHEHLQKNPFISVVEGERNALKMSSPTLRKSILRLVQLGILEEITKKRRGQIFVYRGYLNKLSKETEPNGANDA